MMHFERQKVILQNIYRYVLRTQLLLITRVWGVTVSSRIQIEFVWNIPLEMILNKSLTKKKSF